MSRTKHLAAERAAWFKSAAAEQGFAGVGIARAEFLSEEAANLEQWLSQGYAGEMAYLERNVEMRLDPRLLFPGTRSVISLVFNYHNPEKPEHADAPRIAQYALGEDYHYVLKWKLKEILKQAQAQFGDFQGRAFVDSAPMHERAWARRSGLGWIGKNSLLLNKGMGSQFFLAELLVDLDLAPDAPVQDHCGSCTACIDACPTGAIIQPEVVDGSKCISYFTIELRGAIPEPYAKQLGEWVFGCDICQDVCPWNRRHAKRHSEERLQPRPGVLEMSRADWVDLTEETFREVFKSTPLKRTGWEGIRRNLGLA